MRQVNWTSRLSSVTIALLMFTASLMGYLMAAEDSSEKKELRSEEVPNFVSSPGHPVFSQYITSDNCVYCYEYGSPAHHNIKTQHPDDYVYISYQSVSYGDTDTARAGNTPGYNWPWSTSGAPDSYWGDRLDERASGCGSNTCYDSMFASGGGMSSSTTSQYSLTASVSGTGSMLDVTIEVEYLGSGSAPSNMYLYAAMTEEICNSYSYSDGSRGHNCWKSWLMSDGEYRTQSGGSGSGFQSVTLSSNSASYSWSVPSGQVNGGTDNALVVAALMTGAPSTGASNEHVLTATDSNMGPLIDVGITDFSADNQNGNLGFVSGDSLNLNVEITNFGVESYNDGGQISVFELSGLDEVYLGGGSVNNMASGATQSLTVQFDSSHIDTYPSGTTTFRARLSGLTADRDSSNNYADVNALHDMAPVANQPTAVASVSIDRGDTIQFESTALSNDLVDDMTTMNPTIHYALSGTDFWDDAWISSSELLGSGGNARFLHTIDAPLNADVGPYDLRIRWTDSGGQQGDWLLAEGAFTLHNGLPVVLNGDSSQYAGMPTVKVETEERISAIGLVHDAETPLSMLTIDSNSPEFIEWDPSTLELLVNFDEVVRDSEGNPIPQGIFVSIDDGDDINSGMMMFNVIENGAPRWAPIPSQSFDEGGSASISLTGFLSDTDDSGNPIPTSGLTLELISNSDESLVEASVSGHSLSVSSLDDDSTGMVELEIRASDGSKTSDTIIVFHVLNVNDAPRMDMEGIEEFTVEMGERITLELLDRITDIDDPDEEIWPSASTFVPGAAQLNQITGILSMEWSEAGTEIVTITLEDRHGDANAYMITVTVVDNLPLLWDNDLLASFDTIEYGTNPTVVVENVGPLELSDVRVIWSVCNSITGVCHSSGVSHNLGPFIVNPSSGDGLGIGDYVTLSVSAEDQDGFDRLTEIQFKIFAIEPVEITEPEPEEGQNDDSTSGISKWFSTGLLVIGILLSTALVMALAIALRRQKSDSVAAIDFSEFTHDEAASYQEPTLAPGLVPPPPPMVPPLPPEGLPPGWTMEQWHYYGEEYLRRRQ